MLSWRILDNKVFIFSMLVDTEGCQKHFCLVWGSSVSIFEFHWFGINGSRKYSLMTLMWLINNIMILTFWSRVFMRNTNEWWVRWSLFFCCYLGDNKEFCFSVTCQFCMGVSHNPDYAHVKLNHDVRLLAETHVGKCILHTFKVSMFVGFRGCCVSALCACAT